MNQAPFDSVHGSYDHKKSGQHYASVTYLISYHKCIYTVGLT